MGDEEVNMGDVVSEVKEERVSKNKTNRFRENPWIVSTIVIGIVLVLVIAFGGAGYRSGGSIVGNVVSGEQAADNLVSFIESQSQAVGAADEVEIVSSERDGELYRVTLNFQGQEIPVFVSLDGKYLISDIIPLDPSLLPSVNPTSAAPVDIEVGDSPVKGDANAPVTIVEFSDYQCPFCRGFYTETLPLIEMNYIATGKAKLVYKDFPLDIHPDAQKAAEAARCVGEQIGNKGYFEMHDLLFENQQDLSFENYKEWARTIEGVDGARFDKCLDDGEFTDLVFEDFFYGQTIGVSGTPAFFINGRLVSGAQPYSVFEGLIEEELRRGNI